jgi:hypothetical protein
LSVNRETYFDTDTRIQLEMFLAWSESSDITEKESGASSPF